MQGLFDLNRSLPGENDLLLLVADLLVFESWREKGSRDFSKRNFLS